jgi:hypothetical protein
MNRGKVLLKCLPGFCRDSLLKDRQLPMEKRESRQESRQLNFYPAVQNRGTPLPLIGGRAPL